MVGPLAVWALVRVERRAASPLLPVRVLGSRNVRVITGATVLFGAGYMGNFVVTPLFLQGVLGVTAGVTSLLTVPRALSILLASPTAGRAGMRFGERRVALLSGAGLTRGAGRRWRSAAGPARWSSWRSPSRSAATSTGT